MIGVEVRAEGAGLGLEGPLMFLERSVEVGLDEAVEVLDGRGRSRLGRIAAIDEHRLVVEILDPARNLSLSRSAVRFLGDGLQFGVGPGLLGRVLDGVGQPLDGGATPAITEERLIQGLPMNPVARQLPRDFIETGISAIDLLNSLVRGQKLPIFSGGGLPHDRLVLDIARWARLRHEGQSDFAIVLVGMGISFDAAERFQRALEDGGAMGRTVLFLN
ncbi:MAG: hypothetical protein R3200_14780, partial [Xanthomonadales bacterium]|nr:hypothetical protein [Xanthomonadales bacterium]